MTTDFELTKMIEIVKDFLSITNGKDFALKCANEFDMKLLYNIHNTPDSSPIPFERTYTLEFNSTNQKVGIMTIFEAKSFISEIEIQIFNSEIKDFHKGVRIFTQQYGSPLPSPMDTSHSIHFQEPETSGYISIIKTLSINVITLRFANNRIWNEFFKG